jgi:peptidoglycan hydrolase-like protein with peptidoglycan-binding domain
VPGLQAWDDGDLGTRDLRAIGMLDPSTSLLLPWFPGVAAPGDTGTTVVVWQDLLIRAGIISDMRANRDGIYGPATEDAVRAQEDGWGWTNPDGAGVLGGAFYSQLASWMLAPE